mgnify:CR=1 FL=1
MPSKHVAPFYAEHEGWLSGVMHCRKEDRINVMTNPATPYAAAGAALLAVTPGGAPWFDDGSYGERSWAGGRAVPPPAGGALESSGFLG